LPAGEIDMIAGSIQHVIGLFQATQPKLLQTYLKELRGPALFSDDALDTVYPFLPEVPFTAGVLEPVPPDTILAPLSISSSAAV
jgi:hypothetical protein